MTERRWAYSLYHDEDGDAAVDTRSSADVYETEAEAINAARAAFDEYWTYGDVYHGQWHEPVFGVSPGWFETDERDRAVYIAPDGSLDRG